jgi:hypothetical protein
MCTADTDTVNAHLQPELHDSVTAFYVCDMLLGARAVRAVHSGTMQRDTCDRLHFFIDSISAYHSSRDSGSTCVLIHLRDIDTSADEDDST